TCRRSIASDALVALRWRTYGFVHPLPRRRGIVDGPRIRSDLPLPIDLSTLPEREAFDRLLFQKGAFWSYENEYRWARYPNTDWTGIPIAFRGQHGQFGARELAGITVGARMSAGNRGKIIRLAEAHDPPLPVWEAVETDTFDFSFERIA